MKKQNDNGYQIIALYNEGKRFFRIGCKVDKEKPLDDDNVSWWLDKNGEPFKTDEYEEAVKICKKVKSGRTK